MSFTLIIIIAFVLAMDAFAVSITCGIANYYKTVIDKIKLALVFGFFQGFMLILGFYISIYLKLNISKYSGVIAFVILFFIGLHMIKESLKTNDSCQIQTLNNKKVIILAIITSVDAFATGITFSLIDIKIYFSAIVIFVITFIMSYIGIIFGCKISAIFKKRAEIIGAIVIILIGVKILIESF